MFFLWQDLKENLKLLGRFHWARRRRFFWFSKNQPLAATCPQQPLAATCSHLSSHLSSHLQPLALEQMAASGCKWLLGASGCKWLLGASGCKRLQVAASGCKWLQVAARSLRWKGTGEFATFSGGRHRRIVNILRWKAPENSQHSPVENTGELWTFSGGAMVHRVPGPAGASLGLSGAEQQARVQSTWRG